MVSVKYWLMGQAIKKHVNLTGLSEASNKNKTWKCLCGLNLLWSEVCVVSHISGKQMLAAALIYICWVSGGRGEGRDSAGSPGLFVLVKLLVHTLNAPVF